MLPAMTRFRAALTHFALSVLIVVAVFLVVYFLWYPPPLFAAAGGRDLFLIVALVDVTIGPLITLIIFKPGKKGLKFDLVVIALLQLTALVYGTHVVFEARPVWVVFLKDRFDLVRANQINEAERAKARPEHQQLSVTGPQVVGARVPTDPDEKFRTSITALAGIDVSSYPQHYVPYAEIKAEALAKSRSMTELRSLNPEALGAIDAALSSLGRKDEDVRFLPMRAGKRDLTALVDAKTGDLLKLTSHKPWKY